MFNLPIKFAESTEPSGIGAFNLNIKQFLFQLITFVLVLLALRRWALPKLAATIEGRREALEKSLEQAKQTEKTLAEAEAKAEQILAKARTQADTALADADKKVEEIIAKGENAADQRAERIIKEAEERLGQERERLHTELRGELAGLVAVATEKILDKKLDEREDRALIEQSLKELA